MTSKLSYSLAGVLCLLASYSSFSQSSDCKPTVSVGRVAFCEGDTTRLRAEPAANTTYRWFRDTSFIAGATTSSLIVNQSGTYRLEATRREETWGWDMAGGPDSDLNDIQFSGNTGWIVGNYGTLMKTTNGSQWDKIATNRQENFMTVFFLNTQRGWIGGSNGLLLTSSDGGISWNTLALPVTGSVQKINFFNETMGYVLAGQRLFITADGGKTWTGITLPVNADVKDFAFVNATTGWIALVNQVYKTENGGTSWVLQYTANSSCSFVGIEKISAFDTNTCWVEFITCSQFSNFPTMVARTTDGGGTWSEHGVSIPATYPALSTLNVSDLYFADAQTGYIVGRLYKRIFAMYGVSGGAVFKTEDGGQTWRLIHENVSEGNPAAIAFVSPSQGVIVGGKGLLWQVSETGGVTSPYASRTFLPLHSIGGTSQRVFAVGGFPRRTDSGVHPDSKAVTMTLETGKAWVKNETQFTSFGGFLVSGGSTLRQLSFKNDQFGWRVGLGTLATTNNGGQTWESLYGTTQPPTFVIDKAYFQTPNSGYYLARDPALGGAGLYRFTGASRTAISVSYMDTFDANTGMLDLQFINDNVGFITTSNGKLIKTTDGGATWTVQVVRTDKRLQRVFFIDEQMGWVISNDGLILKTQNGGQTWTEQTSGVNTSLNGIYFTSAQTGYIVGAGGLALKTVNGGAEWVPTPTDTRQTLYDVFFKDANNGWAVGDNGVILRLNTGCQSMSDPVVIKVNPLPAKPVISASGDMKLLSSAAAGNQWYLNGSAITGATATEYNPTQSGRYTVQVTQQGCSSALSEAFEYVITATDPLLRVSVVLYPNPASERLFVSLKGLSGPCEVELLSPEGRQLSRHRVASSSQESVIPLELKGLAPGTYIVRVRSGTFTKSSKVVLNL